jgi:hypothetical protein
MEIGKYLLEEFQKEQQPKTYVKGFWMLITNHLTLHLLHLLKIIHHVLLVL